MLTITLMAVIGLSIRFKSVYMGACSLVYLLMLYI